MTTLAAAIAARPRPVRDLPQCLVMIAVVLGSPWLAWRLGQTDGLDAADLGWVAFALSMVVMTHLWWRLETVPATSRGPLLWVLSTGSVALFVLGIAVLAGSPPGLFGIRPDALSAVQRVAVSIGDDPAAAVRALQQGMVLPYTSLTILGEDPIEVGTRTATRRAFPSTRTISTSVSSSWASARVISPSPVMTSES